MEIISTLLIIACAYLIIKTVKIVRVILTVTLSIIYVPINLLNTKVQKWYFHMKEVDPIVYYAFTPLYWVLVVITFIVSVPYEFLIAMDIH